MPAVIYQFTIDDCRSSCWGERRTELVVEMSNSDCGDRGLATRRGVCVSCGMIITDCTACLPFPRAQSCGTTSHMAAICTKLYRSLVCLHQHVPFSGCTGPGWLSESNVVFAQGPGLGWARQLQACSLARGGSS